MSAPPSTVDTVVGVRFLVVFAFLQTMHYVVWVWFLPRYAPDATAAFEQQGAGAHRTGGCGRSASPAALVLAVMFAVDYWSGRSVYAALATYHAYLEFPVLLALLLTSSGGRNTIPAFSADGATAAGR